MVIKKLKSTIKQRKREKRDTKINSTMMMEDIKVEREAIIISSMINSIIKKVLIMEVDIIKIGIGIIIKDMISISMTMRIRLINKQRKVYLDQVVIKNQLSSGLKKMMMKVLKQEQ